MPPQSSATLTSLAAGYEPLAQGIPFQRTWPLQGLPFVGGGGGTLGSMAGMAATPFVQRMMGQVGMVPLGVGHDQNVYDLLMNQRYTQMQMQAMRLAAEADRASIFQTFRGLAAVTGTPFGAEQRRAANALTSTAVMAAPMFAEMMPEFMDQLGGARGSASVMALRLMQAGRYRIDPVSGRMGMEADTVGGLSQQLMRDLYAPDVIGRMQGLRAGQVGGLFQELQARGLVGTQAAATPGWAGLGNDVRSQVIRALQDLNIDRPGDLGRRARELGVDLSRGPQGLSGRDLDTLQADPMVSDRLRAFDTERIKRSLRAYTGAVAAMRDIFGDLGRPNAPMQELVAGLEALTMGSMAQIDPSRLGMMARQTANLARQTGVGLDNALMLQQHAASRAQQMGIEPIFAVQATQGGLGFGGAYRAQGHAAYTAWGAMNADQVQQLDTNLRVQAASSNMANRMAVALRTSETIGGFRQDSAAGRYVAAVQTGLNQFRDDQGNMRSVNLSDPEFMRMLTTAQDTRRQNANISEGDVRAMLGEAGTNREFVERHRLTDIVRRAQGTDEVQPYVAHRMQETLFSRLRDQFTRQGESATEASRRAQEAAVRASRRATERMFQLSTEEFSDTGTRNRLVGDILQDELERTGVFQGMDPASRQQWLRQTAGQFYGHANAALAQSQYRAFGNLQNVHRLTNQTTLNEADRQQLQARFTGEMQEALAPLGRGTMLSRAVDALQNVRTDDPQAMMRVLSQTLGGVRTDDINRALMPAFRRVMDQRALVERRQQRLQQETNPEARVSQMQQLESSRRELTYQANLLAQTGEQFGMFSVDSLGHEDLARAARSTAGLMTAQNDIVGLRGAFGGQVTDAEILSVRAAPMSREVAMQALNLPGTYEALNPDQRRQVDNLTRRGRQGQPASYGEALATLRARRGQDVDLLQRYSALADEEARLSGLGRRTDAQNNQLSAVTAQRQALEATLTSGGQLDLLNKTIKTVQDQFRPPTQAPGQPPPPSSISDPDARRMAVAYLAQNIGNVPAADIRTQMEQLTFAEGEAGNAQARALIRGRRRAIPYRASAGEVQRIQAQYRGQLTGDEARELANARLRAMRLGVDEAEVAAIQEERHIPVNQRGPQSEMDAIDEAFSRRARDRWRVSPEDREDWRISNPRPAPTAEERSRFLEQHPEFRTRNLSVDQINQAMEDRAILLDRQQANRREFAQFWASGEGQAYREQADYAQQDIENVSLRLIQTPQMVSRLGSRAIEMHQQLQRGQQRLRELALYHAGGDLARLTAGNTSIDVTTQEGAAAAERVRAEVSTIQRQQRGIIRELQEQEGQRGRRFQLGDERTARRTVMEREISRRTAAELAATPEAQQRLRAEEERRFLTSQLSPEQDAFVRRFAVELGTEENARRILRYGLTQDLSEYQRSRVAGTRFGAGNEDEARLLYGAEAWDALNPEVRAAKLAQMRAGTQGNQQQAMNILGLTDVNQLTIGDNRARVEAIQAGLLTPLHQRQLAGIEATTPENRLIPAQLEAMTRARVGIASTDWARNRAMLPADPLSSQQRADIQTERERAGNRLEALRQLSLSVTMRPLNDEERARLAGAQRGGMTQEDAMLRILGLRQRDFNQLSAQDQERVRQTMKGLGPRASQRDLMRLLNIDPAQVMTDEQAQRLQQLTYDVGVARRITPEQEQQLTQYQQTERRLQTMAAGQGSSYDAMRRVLLEGQRIAGERLTFLPPEQQARGRAQDAIAAGTRTREHALADLRTTMTRLSEIDVALARADLPQGERNRLISERDTLRDRRQQLVAAVNTGEQQVTDAHTSLAEAARRMGVTTTEMLAGQRSERGLTEMTDQGERERLATAHRNYDAAQYIIRAGSDRIGTLQEQITVLERTGAHQRADSPENLRWRNMRAELETLQGRVGQATVARQTALSAIHEDAVRRGVTDQERLRGRGELATGVREDFGRLARQYQTQAGVVGGIARSLGLPNLASLSGATEITRRAVEMANQALRQEQEDPRNLVKNILTEYGFRQGDEPSQLVGTVASMMEGTLGRGMGQRVLETARTLKQRAQTGGQAGDLTGVDVMAREYFDALQLKPKDKESDEQFRARKRQSVLDFQKKYGFETSHDELTDTGRGQYRLFEQAMQFQQQTGLLTFGASGDERRRRQESDFGSLFRQILQGGPALKPAAGGAGPQDQGGTQRIEGVLKIELEGMHGTGNLTGSYSRHDVAPSA